MRHHATRSAIAAVLAATCILPMATTAAQATTLPSRLALAAYFPWWGTPTGPTGYWWHWYDPSGTTLLIKDTPTMDGITETLYDEKDVALITQHLSHADKIGINAFGVSWWGRGSLEDVNFGILLQTATSVASPVKAAAQFETAGLASLGVTGVTNQLYYILAKYSTSPAYLRYLGRPVVFIYNPAALTTNYSVWDSIIHSTLLAPYDAFFIVDSYGSDAAAVFDGMYQYEPFGPGLPYNQSALTAKYQAAKSLAVQMGKLFVASVEPGFDDSAVRPQTMYVPRNGVQTYDQTWSIALSTSPDWIWVATWNEWHEATEIEQSVEYSNNFLRDTQRWTATLHA